MDEFIDNNAIKAIKDRTVIYEEEERGYVEKIKHEKDPGKLVSLSKKLDNVRHSLKISIVLTASEVDKGRIRREKASEGELAKDTSSPGKKTKVIGLMGVHLAKAAGGDGEDDEQDDGTPAHMKESSGKRTDSPVRKLPQQKKENQMQGRGGGRGGRGGRGRSGGRGRGGVGLAEPPIKSLAQPFAEDPQDTVKINVAQAYVKSSLREYLDEDSDGKLASPALVHFNEFGKPEEGAAWNILNIQDNPTPAEAAKSNIHKGNPYVKTKVTSAVDGDLMTVEAGIDNPVIDLTNNAEETEDKEETGKGNKGAEIKDAVKGKEPQGPPSKKLSWAEQVKQEMESQVSGSVRVRLTFKARNNGTMAKGRANEIVRLVTNILNRMPDTELMPWKDFEGSKNVSKANMDNKLMTPNEWIRLVHCPVTSGRGNSWKTNETNKINLRFKTKLRKEIFINKWNSNKRSVLSDKDEWTPMYLAELQASPTAFLVGAAAGSTEDQDLTGISDFLSKLTNIRGIGISYQIINQPDVTQEFWQRSSEQQSKREAEMELEARHWSFQDIKRQGLQTKFKFAPSAACIYVPDAASVGPVTKILMKALGRTKNGAWPDWGNGSSMRFFPLKGRAIRKADNFKVIKKRCAIHVYMKGHAQSLDTSFRNVNETIPSFKGETFAQKFLQSRSESGNRAFLHLEKPWTLYEDNQKWRAVITPGRLDDAKKILGNFQAKIVSEYGTAASMFFSDFKYNKSDTYQNQVDDEDWDWSDNSDDETETKELEKQGILFEDLQKFLNPNARKEGEDDNWSSMSWNTGKTNATQASTNTTQVSTITQSEHSDRTDSRTHNVQMALLGAGLSEEERDIILSGVKPWEQLIKWMNESEDDQWSLQLFITKFRGINAAITKDVMPREDPMNIGNEDAGSTLNTDNLVQDMDTGLNQTAFITQETATQPRPAPDISAQSTQVNE